jgi:hypothetical protein
MPLLRSCIPANLARCGVSRLGPLTWRVDVHYWTSDAFLVIKLQHPSYDAGLETAVIGEVAEWLPRLIDALGAHSRQRPSSRLLGMILGE